MEKQYNHQTSELAAQQKWATQNTYSLAHNPGPLYSIDTPPPTVSGKLHIGHIFSYTQTDIIARYKRMRGFSVFYPFGFDDNGLPTERFVEKKRGIQAYQVGRSEFIKICLEETKIAGEEFKSLWQRIGLSVDWDLVYSTISADVRQLSQTSFIELYEKGFVYRKQEPALYCTNCRTSVAQAELDDKEVPSFFNDIVFKDIQGNDLIIGTTRPELLPACVAVFYNPDDERYKHLKGQQATVPLFNFTVPILADELVNPEKGTGLVMCCTFGDKTDITWFKKYNLPYKQVIGFDGKLTKESGFLAGLKVPDARIKVIEELIKQNLLVRQQEIKHSVNVHERCKKEIEYLLLNQWFIKILPFKKQFIELAEQIKWHPTFMKTRYTNWVENLGWDWGISRQRLFGIPFPVWHCKDCNAIILADKKQLPIDPQETSFTKACPDCKSNNIVPDTDVMDTWNTSSLTPYICAQLYTDTKMPSFDSKIITPFLPMSMRPQAHDIIRTWAFYTIVKAWMHNKIIPWFDIVISGHVLSDAKEKISKSKGNALLEPENLLKQYPADAVRYWTASGSLGHDVAFSESQLKVGIKLITKLWNAFRFIHEHTNNFKPTHTPEHFGIVNEWLLHAISHCFQRYSKHLDDYEFSLALNQTEQFFWQDFCDNYLELIKHQLFNPAAYSKEEMYATHWTLHTTGLRILQLYAPYLPYITETIYESIYSTTQKISSLHQTKFEQNQVEYVYPDSVQTMQKAIELINQVRKLKTEKQLSLKVPLASLIIYSANDVVLNQIKKVEKVITGITQAEKIIYTSGIIDAPLLTDKQDQWHASVII